MNKFQILKIIWKIAKGAACPMDYHYRLLLNKSEKLCGDGPDSSESYKHFLQNPLQLPVDIVA
jgi:hypothetical protein